jgi:hydroxypyruvate isomerase
MSFLPNQIEQSVAWWCFVPERLTPEQFISEAGKAGFTALDLVPPEYLPLVKEHGLSAASISGHQSLTIGLNRRDQHSRIEQEVRANLTLAEQYGIPNLICFSGNRDGLTDSEGAEITAEGLAKLAPAAEAAGVTLVLELLNSKIDHPDYQADHTNWGVQVCERVNSPKVKLLYDIYHMQIMEGDLIRTIQSAHSQIAHYHTAGNPGRNDLDSDQEIYYPPIFKAIQATGFRGYIAHEFLPKGDPATALRRTYSEGAQWLLGT